MICIALRHVYFEDLGLFAEPLRRRGYTIRYIDTPVEPIDFRETHAADLLIVLGGPVGIGQRNAYPWLESEIAAVMARLATGRPTLGICLGAQIIASALGAAVVAAATTELGWAPLELSAEGFASPLSVLDGLPVLHWHGDGFELPSGARSLASTLLCPHQAFAVGDHVLGLLFHAEVDPAMFEHWLVGNAAELTDLGIGPGELRRATDVHGGAMIPAASAMVEQWLDTLSWPANRAGSEEAGGGAGALQGDASPSHG